MSADLTSLAAFARRVLVAIALAALACLLWRAVDVLFLVLGGVVVAVLLRAGAEPIARRTRVPDRWAVAAVAIVILVALVLVGWLAGTEVNAQVSDLLRRLPQVWQGLQQRLGVSALGGWLRSPTEAITSGTGGVLASLAGYASTLGGALANLILMLVGGVFLATHPDLYRTGLLKLVPGERRGRGSRARWRRAAARCARGCSASSRPWRSLPQPGALRGDLSPGPVQSAA